MAVGAVRGEVVGRIGPALGQGERLPLAFCRVPFHRDDHQRAVHIDGIALGVLARADHGGDVLRHERPGGAFAGELERALILTLGEVGDNRPLRLRPLERQGVGRRGVVAGQPAMARAAFSRPQVASAFSAALGRDHPGGDRQPQHAQYPADRQQSQSHL
jgi:hypothetical protein